MSADDDQIRRALSTRTPHVAARSALRDLRPTMQRARMRRRVAVSATAAALLVGGGAGVFALATSRDETTLRSVTSDQSDRPIPPVTEVGGSSTTVSTTVAAFEEPLTVIEPPMTVAPPSVVPTTAAPGSDQPDEARTAPTEDATTRSVADEPPATPVPTEPPTTTAPAPASASFQTITSACGDVVVSIDAGTVQIVTITARPGFDQQVTDDGPKTIELTFTGDGDQKCELHAELKSSGLDVEVQNPETEG